MLNRHESEIPGTCAESPSSRPFHSIHQSQPARKTPKHSHGAERTGRAFRRGSVKVPVHAIGPGYRPEPTRWSCSVKPRIGGGFYGHLAKPTKYQNFCPCCRAIARQARRTHVRSRTRRTGRQREQLLGNNVSGERKLVVTLHFKDPSVVSHLGVLAM